MPSVLPSDVVKLIDESFPWAKSNAVRSGEIVGWNYGPSVASVVALLKKIPTGLIANSHDYAALIAGQAGLAHLARTFESGIKEGRYWPEVRGMNAMSAVRQALANCPDHQTEPALPYTSRELLVAFDFLDAIWERRFKKRLLMRLQMERAGGLVLPCASEDEFRSRLSDLADVLKRIEAEPQSTEGQKIPRGETLNRVKACLFETLGQAAFSEIESAVQTLADINTLRVHAQHTASKADVVAAAGRLGITYPVVDYAETWRQIVHQATDALNRIRGALSDPL